MHRKLPFRLALATSLILAASAARADDYGFRFDFGTDFNGPNWVDNNNPTNPDGTLRHAGPPGSGDTASIAGSTSNVVTCSGGSVASLSITCKLQLSGALTAQSFTDGGALTGSGTLNAPTLVGVAANVDGGNLVAGTFAGTPVVTGGTFSVTNYSGNNLVASAGGKITVGNTVSLKDTRISAHTGASISVPGLSNGRDVSIVVHDADSILNVANGLSSTAATVDIQGGAMLKVGGEMILNGGKDADGNDVGGGGSLGGAGTFASVTNTLSIGQSAPRPGFAMSITAGAALSTNSAFIGEKAGSFGTVTMSDADTVWNLRAGGLVVGDAGTGQLTMSSGARLVFGGTTAFAVGFSAGGHGRLDADGAGTVVDARAAVLSVGKEAGSEGNLAVDAGASLLLGNDTFVGDAGSGGLNVSGASQASIGTDTGARSIKFGVGNEAGSAGSVSVQGAGSQFYMGDHVDTFVGVNGSGFFGVGTGGSVRTSLLAVAGDPAITGQIVIDGAGSTWTNTDVMSVGGTLTTPGGAGTVALSNGAQMRAAVNPGAKCFISATGKVTIDATSQFAVGGGAFGPGGSMRVTGILAGKGRQAGTTVLNTNVVGNVIVGAGGKFKPGADPDVFTVQGNCDLSDGGAGGGDIEFEIGGAGTPGVDYDQLVVTGTLTLGGTLRLVPLPGYVPKVGDSFTLIKAGSMAGQFTAIDAPGLTIGAASGPGGVAFMVTAVNAVAAPVITSLPNATASLGSPFSYLITATNSPAGYAATGLAPGLDVDPATGLISGTPTAEGVYPIAISATNVGGTGAGTLTLTVGAAPVPGAPVINSAPAASGQIGAAFSYQITATNGPTSFAASGLPDGLVLDPATGIVSGTPTTAGAFTVTFTATNALGSGTATVVLTIDPPALPIVTVTSKKTEVHVGQSDALTFTISQAPTVKTKIRYVVKGSAVNGEDYVFLSGKAKLKPGETKVKVQLTPRGDLGGAESKKVKLELVPDPAYTIGTTETLKIKLLPE